MEKEIPLREKSFGWAQIVVGGLGIAYLIFVSWTVVRCLSLGSPMDEGIGFALAIMLMVSPSILLFALGVATVNGGKWARIVNGVLIPLGILGWTGFHISTYLSHDILYIAQKTAASIALISIPILCFHWPNKFLRKVTLLLGLLSVLFLAGYFAFGV
ncbi:MAG: hypothetical protein JXD21_06960 [Candidatus Omnitrophica bacterium]|nr:hypothetical protein [Candidatus Omnitrophota bacterium]